MLHILVAQNRFVSAIIMGTTLERLYADISDENHCKTLCLNDDAPCLLHV